VLAYHPSVVTRPTLCPACRHAQNGPRVATTRLWRPLSALPLLYDYTSHTPTASTPPCACCYHRDAVQSYVVLLKPNQMLQGLRVVSQRVRAFAAVPNTLTCVPLHRLQCHSPLLPRLCQSCKVLSTAQSCSWIHSILRHPAKGRPVGVADLGQLLLLPEAQQATTACTSPQHNSWVMQGKCTNM